MTPTARNAARIDVQRRADSDPPEFDVTVSESGAETRHRVTLSASDSRRLAGAACSLDQCVAAAFRFLLEREPKEAILRRFDITVIARYFPEFEAQLPRYVVVGDGS